MCEEPTNIVLIYELADNKSQQKLRVLSDPPLHMLESMSQANIIEQRNFQNSPLI